MKILNSNSKNFDKSLDNLLSKRKKKLKSSSVSVTKIINDVKKNGDKAILKYEKRFNKNNTIIPNNKKIKKTISSLSPKVKKAIDFAYDRIYKFHSLQKVKNISYVDKLGNRLQYKYCPIDSVAIYVPGSTVSYPSSVLMNAIPAIVAGVKRIVAPNIRPFDFILSLSDKARCETYIGVDGPQPAIADNLFKGSHADFVFFETARRSIQSDGGWFFVPLQREAMTVAESAFGGDGAGGEGDLLFTLNNSVTTTGGEGSDTVSSIDGYTAAMLRSLNFDFVTTGDKWYSVADGSWCGTNIRHNPYTKSFDVYKSDYLKHLKEPEYSHASKTPVYWPPDPAWRKISEWPESNVSYSSSAGSRNISNINTNTRRADYPWRKSTPEHSLLRKLQLNHMYNYERVQCEMHGISGLQVGKMAHAQFPQIGKGSGPPEITGISDSRDVYGEDRNNNTWMITKVAHHIVFADTIPYKSTMELANTMRTTKRELPEYGSLNTPSYSQRVRGR